MLFMNLKAIPETKKFLRIKNLGSILICLFLFLGNTSRADDSTSYRLYFAAWDFIHTHEYYPALEKLDQARKLFIKQGNYEWAAYCNTATGDVYERKGELEASYEYLQKSIALLTELQHTEGLGKTYFCMGKLLRRMKRYQQSNDAYRYTIAYVDQPRFKATSFNNMGVNFRELGQLDSAQYYHHQSIKLNLKLKRPVRVAKALSNLGMISFAQADYQQALEFYKQSEELHALGTDSLSLFKLYNRFGATYKELENFEAALDYLLKGKLIDFKDPQEIMLNRELLLEVRLMQKAQALAQEIAAVDQMAQESQRHLWIAFLLIFVLLGILGVIYFRQQVINLNQELKHDDLVKQLHEAKLLFVKRCLHLIKPELDQVSEDVMSNKRIDAVLGLKQTQSIIDEIDTEISKN